MYDYDLIVIGSGPAGHSAAIQAAKINKRVALIEQSQSLGGNMVHSGTIPSKTLREAVLYLTGYREHNVYGDSYSVKKDITMNDLLIRTDYVIQHEIDTLKYQLSRNHIDIISAQASFISNNEGLNLKIAGFFSSLGNMTISSFSRSSSIAKSILVPHSNSMTTSD